MSLEAVAYSQEASDNYDDIGRKRIRNYLEKYGWVCTQDIKNDAGVDLKFILNGRKIYVDPSVQQTRFPWEDLRIYKGKRISILPRKYKYKNFYGEDGYLFECNKPVTYAFIVPVIKLDLSYIEERNCRGTMEKFIMQPIKDCNLVKLI